MNLGQVFSCLWTDLVQMVESQPRSNKLQREATDIKVKRLKAGVLSTTAHLLSAY